MGTLDREKKTYEWVSEDGFACKVFGTEGSVTSDELYRLACDVEDQRINVGMLERDRARILAEYHNSQDELKDEQKVIRSQQDTIARQVEQIRNQARTIADQLATIKSCRDLNSDMWSVRREQEAAIARQEATIKSLREQLLAANRGGFPPSVSPAWIRETVGEAMARFRREQIEPKVSYRPEDLPDAFRSPRSRPMDPSKSFAAQARVNLELHGRISELEKRIPGCPACRPGDFDDEHGRSR